MKNPVDEALGIRNKIGAESGELDIAAQRIVVDTDDKYMIAGELLKSVRTLEKKIKDTFKPIKQSMDAAKKQVLAAEQEALLGPMNMRSTLERKMEDYAEHVEAERERAMEEARARVEKEAEELGVPVSSVPMERPDVEIPKVKGISHRIVWKYEIEDASKIHPDYMTPDTTKIGKIVRSVGADAQSIVGGIRVWKEKTTATKL